MDVCTTSATPSLPPLTLDSVQEIANLLSESLSPDPKRQRRSEQALKAMESRENFASCLLELLVRRDQVERPARWLASVYLKNVIMRNWRTRLHGCILSEEKERVRQGLFGLIDEPDAQIGVQIALAVSKVARFDYPKEWPDVVERLMGVIGEARAGMIHLGTRIAHGSRLSGDGEDLLQAGECVLHRAYMALHLVLKELASKRLAADQRVFEGLCEGIYETLVGWWMEDCGSLRPEVLERIVLEMKCIHRVVVLGFPSDSKTLQLSGRVQSLCPFLVTTLRSWLQVVDALTPLGPTPAPELMVKPTLKLLKMVRMVQETHCWAFAASGSLTPYLDLLCEEVLRGYGGRRRSDRNDGSGVSGRSLSGNLEREKHMRVLAAICSVVKCPGYRGSSSSLLMPAGKARELKQQLERMADEVKSSLRHFWTLGDKDAALLTLVVQQYFALTSDELALWDADGEGFHQEMEHAAKEETLRGCAELLYNALLESDRERLAPVVVRMMHQCGTATDFAGSRAVQVLDTSAVMHAVSLGAYDLYDHVDFSEILRGSILPIISRNPREDGGQGAIQGAPADLRELRREALRLVSHWVPKIKPPDKPTVYAMLVSILPEQDSAMFLMACSALQAVMEDWDFDVEQFRPLATDVVRLLIDDLGRCSDYESQLEIFSVLNLVIDHLQERAKECAPMILHMIPQLWDKSEGQGLLRIQILLALQRLVHVLGSDSPMTYHVVLPILRFVINADNPDAINTLEDGVCLWIVVLRHAPGPLNGLEAPLGGLLRIMRNSTEHIFTGTRCITSTVLLYGDDLLRAHGCDINAVLGGYIGNVRDKAITDIIHCLDVIIQMCPQQGIHILADTITALMIDVLNPERGNQVVAPFLAFVVSRMAIRSPEELMQLFEYACNARGHEVFIAIQRCEAAIVSTADAADHVANSCAAGRDLTRPPCERLLACFLDLWLDKFDSIASKGMRKMAALGLCAMLKLDLPCLKPRFGEIVTHVAAVWAELEQGPNVDSLGLSYSVAGTGPRDDFIPVSVDLEEAEGETARRQACFARSPIATLRIKESFQESMRLHGQVLMHPGGQLNEEIAKMLDELLR